MPTLPPEEKRALDAQTLAQIRAALAGDGTTMQTLVARMAPVVHVRVARALTRRRGQARGRDLRPDVEDLVQEVFAALFSKQGRALKAWVPERGLSFENFVGLVAEREVASILRCGKRNPWTEDPTIDTKLGALDDRTPSPEAQVESRQMLAALSQRLRERLSPLGQNYFQLLFVEQRSVAEVAKSSGTTPDALYAWRSRLGKLVRQLREEISNEGEDAA